MTFFAGENLLICSWPEQEQAYTFTRCPSGFPGFGLSQPQSFCEDMKIVAEIRVDFLNQLNKGTSLCHLMSCPPFFYNIFFNISNSQCKSTWKIFPLAWKIEECDGNLIRKKKNQQYRPQNSKTVTLALLIA